LVRAKHCNVQSSPMNVNNKILIKNKPRPLSDLIT
jgi:hypothetical protein